MTDFFSIFTTLLEKSKIADFFLKFSDRKNEIREERNALNHDIFVALQKACKTVEKFVYELPNCDMEYNVPYASSLYEKMRDAFDEFENSFQPVRYKITPSSLTHLEEVNEIFNSMIRECDSLRDTYGDDRYVMLEMTNFVSEDKVAKMNSLMTILETEYRLSHGAVI